MTFPGSGGPTQRTSRRSRTIRQFEDLALLDRWVVAKVAAAMLFTLGASGSEIGSPDPVSALAPFETSDPVGASWTLAPFRRSLTPYEHSLDGSTRSRQDSLGAIVDAGSVSPWS